MGSDIYNHNYIVVTNEGKRILSEFHKKAGFPSQKLIREFSGLSAKTIRRVLRGEPCQRESVERLYTTLSAISQQSRIPLVTGIHYTRVGSGIINNRKTSTDMAYIDLLDRLREQESQGKVGLVVDQKTNKVIMTPSNLLNQERFVLPPKQWINPRPFDFTAYWHLSGSEAELERIQALKPGEVTDSEHLMFRVPRIKDGVWYTELCLYSMRFYCLDLGYTQARLSSSNPCDYEIVRKATPEEASKLVLA